MPIIIIIIIINIIIVVVVSFEDNFSIRESVEIGYLF
jgi:hypothetical protein